MVGRDRVAEYTQSTRAGDPGCCSGWLLSEIFKEWRFGDIGRCRPVVDFALGDALDGFPQFSRSTFDVSVVFLEGLGVHGKLQQLFDFLRGWPDVAQENFLAALALANRLGHQIDIHVAGDGVSYYQRWRCQEIGANVRMNPCFKVTVARQDG